MSVERWIELAQAGDATAFNRLVEAYQSAAYQVAYYQLGNADDALDACQDAMVSAWRAIGTFDGDAIRFRAWLLRIVVNASRDRLRYERRRPRQPIEFERDGESRILPLPDSGQSPEAYAETADLRDLLGWALSQVSEDHRTVILLDQVGLSYPEIADVLAVEVGTVKSRMSRARARMRAVLEGRAEPYAGDQRSGGRETITGDVRLDPAGGGQDDQSETEA